MPTKFVTRAAERAGVSLETAEHRWAEAKAKVHKGKRRGSWYWGKVMNTFKRMMGLMEAVTLKEWLLLEDFDEDVSKEQPSKTEFSDWPDEFMVGNGWTFTLLRKQEVGLTYAIRRLLDDKVKGYFQVANHKFDRSWFISNSDGLSGVGRRKDFLSGNPTDFIGAKNWLKQQLDNGLLGEQQGKIGVLLPEADLTLLVMSEGEDDHTPLAMLMMQKLLDKGEKVYVHDTREDFNKGNPYAITKGELSSWQMFRGNVCLMIKSEWGSEVATVIHPSLWDDIDLKKVRDRYVLTTKSDPRLHLKLKEVKDISEEQGSLPKLFQDWPDTFMIGGGWVFEQTAIAKTSISYNITRLMDEQSKGTFYASQRPFDSTWEIYPADDLQPVYAHSHKPLTDVEPSNFTEAKKWLEKHLNEGVIGEQNASLKTRTSPL